MIVLFDLPIMTEDRQLDPFNTFYLVIFILNRVNLVGDFSSLLGLALLLLIILKTSVQEDFTRTGNTLKKTLIHRGRNCTNFT